MKKIIPLLLWSAISQAQTWQIMPMYPESEEVCQNDHVTIPITIWNNGTSPLSGIEISHAVEDNCPAVLFQGASCFVYLKIDTSVLGFQKNETEFRASPNYYAQSDYPVNVKACGLLPRK